MIETFCSKNQDGYSCKFVTKNDISILGETAILPVVVKAPTNQIKGSINSQGKFIFEIFQVENFDFISIVVIVIYVYIYISFKIRPKHL